MPLPIRFIAEIGLKVKNLETMTAFYQDVLGFKLHLQGEKHVFLEIAELPSQLGHIGHPQLLALFDRDSSPDQRVTSLDHLAFEVPAGAFEKVRADIIEKGLLIRERAWPDTLDWRAHSFFFKDPEGNVLEIVAALGDH